jgi:hypothetical protein
MTKKIFFLCVSAALCLSCSRRDDKYQEFVDEQPYPSGDTKKEAPKDTSSREKTVKLRDPDIIVSPLETIDYLGKYVGVRGYVAQVTKRERVAYLNFVEPFPKNPFTAVIFASRFTDFPDMEKYLYKNVEVVGIVSVYKGSPQIILSDPSQIRMIK